MKKFVITLVIMFAFMMTSCGQNDVASADNRSNLEFSFNDSETVKEFVAFTPQEKKRAKQIAQSKFEGKSVYMGSAVTFKNKKRYWTVIANYKTYAFTSDLNFNNVSYELAPGTNAKDYAKSKN